MSGQAKNPFAYRRPGTCYDLFGLDVMFDVHMHPCAFSMIASLSALLCNCNYRPLTTVYASICLSLCGTLCLCVYLSDSFTHSCRCRSLLAGLCWKSTWHLNSRQEAVSIRWCTSDFCTTYSGSHNAVRRRQKRSTRSPRKCSQWRKPQDYTDAQKRRKHNSRNT